MENNEYQTTPLVKSEHTNQENKNKTETTGPSIEEQYFGLPFKERMKIHNKRMKLKIKAKSQEWKAIAKVKSEQFRVKGNEFRENLHKKNRNIHAKIKEYRAREKQPQQTMVSQKKDTLESPVSEPSKYCSECGVQVSISGRFCPGCGALH
jgi:hypothetical protein